MRDSSFSSWIDGVFTLTLDFDYIHTHFSMNFRLTCVIGFVGLGLYYVTTFSYPFLPGHLQTFSEQGNHIIILQKHALVILL